MSSWYSRSLFLIKPSLTTDLLRLSKAKPRKKKMMAIRIGGKVKTSKVLIAVKILRDLHCDDVGAAVDSLNGLLDSYIRPARVIDISYQIVSIAGIDGTDENDISEDEYQVGCVIFTGLSTSPYLMIVEEFHNH